MNSAAHVGFEEGYERWAATYDQGINPLLAREERYVRPLLSNLSGEHVLDLACGTGRWLERLSLQGTIRGVGVDYSAAMLERASTKAPIRGRLLRADCLKLPFCPFTFDLAICSFALSHIPDLRPMLSELGRVLKPNAGVLVTDLHYDAYANGWRTSFRDGEGIVEIETLARPREAIIASFHSEGFECRDDVALYLGEPERPMFDEARKTDSFEHASRIPALQFFHFRFVVPETSGNQNGFARAL